MQFRNSIFILSAIDFLTLETSTTFVTFFHFAYPTINFCMVIQTATLPYNIIAIE